MPGQHLSAEEENGQRAQKGANVEMQRSALAMRAPIMLRRGLSLRGRQTALAVANGRSSSAFSLSNASQCQVGRSFSPTILDTSTSSDTVIEERTKVSLRCEASGYPDPKVSWRREDGKEITLGIFGGRKYTALNVPGEYLNISQVYREDMAAYLCIASNGVAPSMS
ncbi:lachesin [Caerostris darwini]|uniref:Lachesin n=1 Tax=Caerostris darwini TaxID=1538125 RepID=A0AAV4SG35_9ARAC|nr:lachesin [Caerostris darwini]